jgi:DNA-binding PadR family transcriptional regulator
MAPGAPGSLASGSPSVVREVAGWTPITACGTVPRGMSRARTTGVSAGELVLGLLIERPDHCFSLDARLRTRFASAQFSPTTAYNAVKRLEKDGWARAVDAGTDRPYLIYEATDEGVEHLRDWVRAPTSGLVSREELHAKVSLCEPRDLPRVIDVIYGEECAYAAELERIRERTVAEPRSGGPLPMAERDWSELMENAVVESEVALAGGRRTQLEGLREFLEELRPEAERRALAEHRSAAAEDRRTG